MKRRREPETAGIRAVTHDGRGIADVEGKKVFVAGALAGERVRFVRRRRRRNYDEAELLEVIDPAPERIEPRCAVFGRCGGCALMHIGHRGQLDIKQQALADSLERIGKVRPGRWLDPLTGPEWHYRRRARLAVKDVAGKGRVLVGFRERHAPFITDMHRCEVLALPAATLIDPLSELIGALTIRARVPQIEVAVAENALALVFRVLDSPTAQDRETLARFGATHDCRIYLQPGGNDSVVPLYPAGELEPLRYSLPAFGLEFAFEPLGFVQINAEVNRAMVGLAIGLLAPGNGDRVLDLYCGLGNFSLALARQAGEVLGVEGDGALVASARANAGRNGLDNVRFIEADLSRVDAATRWLAEGHDAVLLDPARPGAAEVVDALPATGARRIVYVSCHPGTLARDAGRLIAQGDYRLEAAGIIDMFPHTAHVESIVVFDKNK